MGFSALRRQAWASLALLYIQYGARSLAFESTEHIHEEERVEIHTCTNLSHGSQLWRTQVLLEPW